MTPKVLCFCVIFTLATSSPIQNFTETARIDPGVIDALSTKTSGLTSAIGQQATNLVQQGQTLIGDLSAKTSGLTSMVNQQAMNLIQQGQGLISSFGDKTSGLTSAVSQQATNLVQQGQGIIGNLGTKTSDLTSAASQQATNLVQQGQNLFTGIFKRPFGRDVGILEQESLPSKAETAYGYAQQLVSNLLQPKPILDTISEEEKYGNTGDRFKGVGDALIGGYENFSKILTTAIDFPVEAMKQVTRKASSYLSTVGAKLVGLA